MKSSTSTKRLLLGQAVTLFGMALAVNIAYAEKKYDAGASDTEIKIGQTMPYSGPASAYGQIGKAEVAYFKMVNEQGGINGRKITLISLDDSYSPPKTVEQVRKLVEQDNVLFVMNTLGTPSNTAIQKYMNEKKVPQLFVATGASKWGDPQNYPWTMGWQPHYQAEARAYGVYIMQKYPNAKIGVLYQNDDFGKDYIKGLRDALGAKADKMIVKEVSYEVTDPTVDSQVVTLKGAGVDLLVNASTPKFAAQSIRKISDLEWKPVHILTNVSANRGTVFGPAGLDKSKGIITAGYFKDVTDPQWKDDAGFKEFDAWVKKNVPDSSILDGGNVYGYSVAQTLVHVLKACGDNLTRENIMKQSANIKNLKLPMLLPGIVVNTSPTDFYPIEAVRLSQFDGEKLVYFGEVIGK